MSIETRQLPAETGTKRDREVARRPDDGASIGDSRPPARDLLPLVGSLVPAPAPAPQRTLALDALHLLRLLRVPRATPSRWLDPAFARDVALVRSHLAPIRSRTALADSFSREAGQIGHPEAHEDDAPRSLRSLVDPVRLAYAIRWLELGDGIPRPGWLTLLDERG
jgi:hypothetical protein